MNFLVLRGVVDDVRTLKPREQRGIKKHVAKLPALIKKHREEFLEVDKLIRLLEPAMKEVLEKPKGPPPVRESLPDKSGDSSFYISPDSCT